MEDLRGHSTMSKTSLNLSKHRHMKFFYSNDFQKCYNLLPEDIRDKVNEKLALFLTNSRLPSLRIKKMKGFEDIWEGRITKSYRFTFQIKGDVYILRKAGPHYILKNP